MKDKEETLHGLICSFDETDVVASTGKRFKDRLTPESLVSLNGVEQLYKYLQLPTKASG